MNKIKVGDNVFISTGKNRGKTGKVLKVNKDNQKIVVEGINIAKKHLKATGGRTRGGIIDITLPIAASNAEVICPRCTKKTRIGFRFENTSKVRFCSKCKEIVDNAS